MTVTLEVYEVVGTEKVVHSTFNKDFLDESALNRYLSEQNKHPFLSIEVKGKKS